MPSIIIRQSIGANAVVNLLSGSQYEFLPFHAYMEGAIGSETAGSLVATVSAGPDILSEEAPMLTLTANALPKYPDDFHYTDDVAAGDRLNFKVRNTTGVAAFATLVLKLNPL